MSEAKGPTASRGLRKVRTGAVVSNKMQKTIVVEIRTRTQHPAFGKILNRTARIKAHDEGDQCSVGDIVTVMETRRLSSQKRWRLVEIVKKAK